MSVQWLLTTYANQHYYIGPHTRFAAPVHHAEARQQDNSRTAAATNNVPAPHAALAEDGPLRLRSDDVGHLDRPSSAAGNRDDQHDRHPASPRPRVDAAERAAGAKRSRQQQQDSRKRSKQDGLGLPPPPPPPQEDQQQDDTANAEGPTNGQTPAQEENAAAAAAATPAPSVPSRVAAATVDASAAFKLLDRFLLMQPHAQDELLPTPANLRLLYVTASRAAACLRVSRWAVSHLQGIDTLPLLEGCYVLVPAQDISDHLPAVDTPAGALPWQMRSTPGLGAPANTSSSSGGSGSSSAASIPWRLRQVEAVEPRPPAPAAAAADGVANGLGPVSDAVLLLAGGGRVRAGAVSDVPLEDVPDLEFLCCELLVLQQHARLPPLLVADVSSSAWRQEVAAKLQERITRLNTERAQMQANGFEPDVVLSAISSAHVAAAAVVKSRPIGYIAQVLPALELAPSAAASDASTEPAPPADQLAELSKSAAAAWAGYTAFKQQQQQQHKLGAAGRSSRVPVECPFRALADLAAVADRQAAAEARTAQPAAASAGASKRPEQAAAPAVAAQEAAVAPAPAGQPLPAAQQAPAAAVAPSVDALTPSAFAVAAAARVNVPQVAEPATAAAQPQQEKQVQEQPPPSRPQAQPAQPAPQPSPAAQQQQQQPSKAQAAPSGGQAQQQRPAQAQQSGGSHLSNGLSLDGPFAAGRGKGLRPRATAGPAAAGKPPVSTTAAAPAAAAGLGAVGSGGGGGGGAAAAAAANNKKTFLAMDDDDFTLDFSTGGQGPGGGAQGGQQQGAAQAANTLLDLGDLGDLDFSDAPLTGLSAASAGLRTGSGSGSGRFGAAPGSGGLPPHALSRSRYGSMFGATAAAGGAGAGSSKAGADASGQELDAADNTAAEAAAGGATAAGALTSEDIYSRFGLGGKPTKPGAAAGGSGGASAGLPPVRVRKDSSDDLARWLDHTAAAPAAAPRPGRAQQGRGQQGLRPAPWVVHGKAESPTVQQGSQGTADSSAVPAESNAVSHKSSGSSSPPPPPPAQGEAPRRLSGSSSLRRGCPPSRSPERQPLKRGTVKPAHRSRSRSRSRSPHKHKKRDKKDHKKSKPRGSRSRSRSKERHLGRQSSVGM